MEHLLHPFGLPGRVWGAVSPTDSAVGAQKMSKMTRILSILSLLGFCAVASTAVAGTGKPVVWASSSTGTNAESIFVVEKSDGSASLMGSVGSVGSSNKVPGIAFDPVSGDLYGISGSATGGAELLKIDERNGNATLIGTITGSGFDPTLTNSGADALVFAADGTLYVGGNDGATPATPGQGYILVVNKSTAAVTSRTAIQNGENIAGMAIDSGGTMWISHGGGGATATSSLHTVNPSTGTLTTTLTLSDTTVKISDLTFDTEGTLYGSIPDDSPDSKLVTINTSTGTVTRVGAFFAGDSTKISGLAFGGLPATVPSLSVSSLALLTSCMLLSALLLMRRFAVVTNRR